MDEIYSYLAQQSASPPNAQEGQAKGGGFESWGLLILAGSFLFMYFLMIRPQRREEKRKKEMLNSLKKGDPIVTSSGIIGTVSSVKENTVFLNIGNGTRVEFLRSAISQIYPEASSVAKVPQASKTNKKGKST